MRSNSSFEINIENAGLALCVQLAKPYFQTLFHIHQLSTRDHHCISSRVNKLRTQSVLSKAHSTNTLFCFSYPDTCNNFTFLSLEEIWTKTTYLCLRCHAKIASILPWTRTQRALVSRSKRDRSNQSVVTHRHALFCTCRHGKHTLQQQHIDPSTTVFSTFVMEVLRVDDMRLQYGRGERMIALVF